MSYESERQTPFAAPSPYTFTLSDTNEAWADARGLNLDDLVTLERARHARPELVVAAHEVAAQSGVKARILRYLGFQGVEATSDYDELTTVVSTVSRRTIRYHVADLAEHGLIARESHAHGTTLRWPDEPAYVVVTETLALYDRLNDLDEPSR